MEFFLSVAVSNSQFSIQTLCHIWLQLSAQKNSAQLSTERFNIPIVIFICR